MKQQCTPQGTNVYHRRHQTNVHNVTHGTDKARVLFKARLPYNLYCVGGDVKHCSIQSNSVQSIHLQLDNQKIPNISDSNVR